MVKKTTIILLLGIIFMITLVSSLFYVYSFNNGLSEENLTWTEAGYIYRNLTLPKYVNVTNASLLLTPLPLYFCYQESANTSNQTGIDGGCSLIYNGNYSFGGSWSSTNNLTDGNISTESHESSGHDTAYFYVNETKLSGATNLFLQVGLYNYIINVSYSSCWSAFSDKIVYRLRSYTMCTSGCDYESAIECYNSSDWILLNSSGYIHNVATARNVYGVSRYWVVQNSLGSYVTNPYLQIGTHSDYCYQELANVSTLCGGLNTGSYSFSDSSNDGNLTTYIATLVGDMKYINYSKPNNSLNTSMWFSKYYTQNAIFVSTIHYINLTIPSDCWNYDANKLVFMLNGSNINNNPKTNWLCYNGTSWVLLYTSTNSGSYGGSGLYEEAMNWSIPLYSNLYDWNYTGEFNTAINLSLNNTKLNTYYNNSDEISCWATGTYNTTCQWAFYVGSAGILGISNLNITYDSDITPPVSIISPNGTNWTKGLLTIWNFTVTDDWSGFQFINYTTYQGTFQGLDNPANHAFVCAGNSVCRYNVSFFSVDNAGNQEALKQSGIFLIDNLAPYSSTVSIVNFSNTGKKIKGNGKIYANFSDEDSGLNITSCEYSNDTITYGTAIWNGTYCEANVSAIVNGTQFNFSIRIKDNATNYGYAYSQINYTTDLNPPIVNYYNFYTDANFLYINFTLLDTYNDSTLNWTKIYKNNNYNDTWDNLYAIGTANLTSGDTITVNIIGGNTYYNSSLNVSYAYEDSTPPSLYNITASAYSFTTGTIGYLYASCNDSQSSIQRVEFNYTNPLDNLTIYTTYTAYSGNIYRSPITFTAGTWIYKGVKCYDSVGNSVSNATVNLNIVVTNPSTGGGGGGSATPTKTCNNSGVIWDLRTLYGQLSYNTAIPFQNTVSVQRELTVTNYAESKNPITIKLSCQKTDNNEINICDYIKFSNTTFEVAPNSQQPFTSYMQISFPPTAQNGDQFAWNIIASDGHYCDYTLENKGYVTRFSFSKFKSFDDGEGGKINYPIIIPAFFIWAILFLIGWGIGKKIDSPFIGIFLIGLIGGGIAFSFILWL